MDSDDDFLGAVFMNESRCQGEGFLEGQTEGRLKGLDEGFHLGCQKGCEIGTELGFYLGYAEAIKQRADSLKNKQRVQKSVDSLVQLIESFPLTDPHNSSLQEQVQAIRAKFKQLNRLTVAGNFSVTTTDIDFKAETRVCDFASNAGKLDMKSEKSFTCSCYVVDSCTYSVHACK